MVLCLLLEALRTPVPAAADRVPALDAVERFWQQFTPDAPLRLFGEWTVNRMAAQCDLGATKFAEYTRMLTGLTPGRYLLRCRLERAARLIVEHADWSITRVATAVGMYTSQYFSTAFRRQFGRSPRAYRRTQAGEG